MMALVHNMWAKSPKDPIDFNPCMLMVPGLSGSMVSNAKNAWLKPKE